MTSIFSYKSQHAFQQICLISLCELQLALRVISAAALANLSPRFNHYSHVCTVTSANLRRHICTVTTAQSHLRSHMCTGDPLKTTVCVWGSKQAAVFMLCSEKLTFDPNSSVGHTAAAVINTRNIRCFFPADRSTGWKQTTSCPVKRRSSLLDCVSCLSSN